ncbi:eukaryotic aspartyl protease [Ancylostoma caninum]|uniref:Eukaryotic aspartyl protease n=1 Tax=Ancylostoma caninum TaxID=29170 RepID=A0A368H8B3_ANCCA|nr:eukaryotic aspartyl protease [Ancylostoma caninum]
MKTKPYETLGVHTQQGDSGQNINVFHDMEYVANITIGKPEQTFTVVLDTGSPDTWVIDYTCSEDKPLVCEDPICDQGMSCKVFCPHQLCCKTKMPRKRNPCRGKRFFESKKSSSYIAMNGTWGMRYRPGGAAKGFFGNDTFRFGDSGTAQLVVPGAKFGQANEIDESLAEHPVDGVVGLAFSSLSFNDAVSPFEQAWKLGLVQPIFTVYMKHVGWKAENVFGGVFTYGGLDKQHCGEVIDYRPLSVATFWKFKVAKITAGKYVYRYEAEAFADTSSSFIGTTSYNAKDIASKLKATMIDDQLTAVGHPSKLEMCSKFVEEHDLFYINCNSNASMTLTIGKLQYTIESKNLIIHVDDDKCILAVYGYATLWGNSWALGAPFLRQFCTVYDMGKEQIGFAKPLQN